MEPSHLDPLVLSFISAVVLAVLLTLYHVYRAVKTFCTPAVNPESTEYESPVTYSVLLLAPCGNGLIKALRQWDPEITLIDARFVNRSDSYLAQYVPLNRAKSLVDKINEHQPDAQVEVVCNKYNSVFTMQEWKEIHNG
jgi:hypothetical protein